MTGPWVDFIRRLNQETYDAAQADPNIPEPVRAMIAAHLNKEWVPGFVGVVVSPLRDGLDEFLQEHVFDLDGRAWFYPSMKFWMAHAMTGHSPQGTSCNADAHTVFLTEQGAFRQFIYANVLEDGSVDVVGPDGFEREFSWWADNFSQEQH